VGVSSLAFLSTGLLVGSYVAEQSPVYVYVVDEDGVLVEYTVSESGTVLSKRVVTEPPTEMEAGPEPPPSE
jgi:hypothetical protein